VVHGDINDRNILLKSASDHGGFAPASGPSSILVRVDLDDVAPEYFSDAHALGVLLGWCVERCSSRWDLEQIARVRHVLQEREDFGMAFKILSG
jgi:hypothetical protein